MVREQNKGLSCEETWGTVAVTFAYCWGWVVDRVVVVRMLNYSGNVAALGSASAVSKRLFFEEAGLSHTHTHALCAHCLHSHSISTYITDGY